MQISGNTHEHFMALALQASKNALPACAPNPPVGCVLVKNEDVVATGFTGPPGQAHAEAAALSRFDESLVDVCAYVTLEPCSFQGRTPSCAVTMLARGIQRVFVAITDPDPRNNGRGIEILREGGVEVIVGVLADEVHDFLAPYLNRQD